MVERRAGSFEDGREIPEDAVSLRGDVALDQRAGRRIDRNLPETKSSEPARMACEYGPMAAGADGLETAWRPTRPP